MADLFTCVPSVALGRGAFEDLGELVSGLGDRALVVTGRGAMRRQGVLDRAHKLLADAGVQAACHEGVPPEPRLADVDAARAAAQEADARVVVGLGGGSALDVAKAAAGLLREPERTAHYFHGADLSGNGVPFVGVPTTFGTGTEATENAVLTDPQARVKKSLRHPGMLAAVAVVDASLGESAPAPVKAQSGMDALTQAVESLMSRHANSLTQSLSLGAATLLMSSLSAFVRGEGGTESAENCAAGSLMAGIALANARLGVVHGVAHPIGLRYSVPHGRVCGVLLPHALRWNRKAASEEYALLSSVAGRDVVEFCEELLRTLGLPTDLGELNVSEADVAPIVAEALPSGSLQANPRPLSEQELAAFVREACGLARG